MLPGHQRTLPANRRKTLTAHQLFGHFTLRVDVGIDAMIALEYFLKLS